MKRQSILTPKSAIGDPEPSAAGMVERVARRLAASRYGHVGGPDADGLARGKPNWTLCVPDARLAIAAVRLPRDHPDEILAGELDAIIDTALAEDTA